MKYQLKLLTEDELEIEICNLYWKNTGFENKYEFAQTVQKISEEKDIPISQVSKIAILHSELWINCTTCDTPFIVKNRKEWKTLISEEFFFEQDCKNCRKSKNTLNTSNEVVKFHTKKNLKLEEAYRAKRWNLCNKELIEILIIIADGYTTKQINSELFRPIISSPDYSQKIWENLNKLEKLGLIWIERENLFEERGKVKKFHIMNRLREKLFKKYNDEFKNGQQILKNNSLEIISKIDDRKKGFIKGNFQLITNSYLKAFKEYEITMVLGKNMEKFTIKINEK